MAGAGGSRRRSQDVATAVAERRFRSARARRRRRQLAVWALVGLLAGAGSFGAGLLAAPLDYDFQPLPPQAVLLRDHDGRVFATIRAPQDQEPVRSADIPNVMKQAIVAAEDERFFEHRGVDPLAVVRALWRDVTGAHLQGGSTITQQYVKNVYTGSERTALRKMREASLAVRLEQHLSKDEILTRYLTTLYLGNGAAGVQAASRYYYGVPLQQLDLDRRTGEHDQTLALALMRGHTLEEPHSAPQCVDSPYHVCNAESGSSYQTLRTALVHSINTVYGPLAVELGVARVVKLMKQAGMRVDPLVRGSDGKPFPAQALGVQVSPLDEAVGYSTLVNHGVRHGPRSVLRVRSAASGELFEAPENPAGERAIPRQVADEVTDAMQEVVDSGTATAARQPFPVYGKTGTTDDFTNAWFTGCTRTLCIAVWMGYDKPYLNHGRTPHSMIDVAGQSGGVYGGTLPARIFSETWSGYRALQESPDALDPTPSAAPTAPAPQPDTSTPAPRPTRQPKPKASDTVSTEPTSSPSPTPTDSGLLPTPVAGEPARTRQAARRDRVST
jgi:membrane peptidoglycan carboxypeptidase